MRDDLNFDSHEESLIKEKDAIRKGEITIIPCRHNAIFTHTNGSKECIRCHKMMEEVELK